MAIAAALTLTACAFPSGPAAAAIVLPGGTVELPVARVFDYFIVEATIEGRGPYSLLLDTGSDFITLDDSLKDAVEGLHRPAVRRIRGATGEYAHVEDGATIDTLRLGALTLRRVPVLFQEVSALGETIAHPIDGLLGIGPFVDHVLELDYPNDRVRVLDRAPAAPEGEVVSTELPFGDASTPMLPVTIGDHRLFCLLDSGCGWPAAIPADLGDELFVPGTEFVRESVSLTGKHERREGRLRETLRLGSFDLRRIRAVAGVGSPKIGAPLLRRFRVVIDASAGTVSLHLDPDARRQRWLRRRQRRR